MAKTVHLGEVPVGDGHPTVLMAEIGTFFNKNMELAENYLEAAASAGFDVFKTEILHDPEVCLKGTGLKGSYKHATGEKNEDYRQLIERKTVPLSSYRKLFERCRDLKMPFVASVYDFEGIDFLVETGAAAVKIARHNITHYPLIRYAAETGLPLIFDSGQIYLDELALAVRNAQIAGARDIIINHHPGANPAPAEVHNLNCLKTYKQAFDCPVGLSCHYRGEEILHVAIGAGVNLIEKGIAADPDAVEQDLVSAASLSEAQGLVKRLKDSWRSLGANLPPVTEPRNLSVRKGLVAREEIKEGTQLRLEDVRFAWPPRGVPVDEWDFINGRRAARNIKPGEIIEWKDIVFEN